ncbi:hypothetical protein niasHT_012786 [Heterodera trifolii]|uniref:Uncharacterized protein n=1 Tax=Heterodera trifolii TaxID=157864 RepID=A0ABD2L923_9BILA
MHEKLKNQQLDTWEQLQNGILKEKEAREQKMKELMRSQKPNKNCTKIEKKLTRKSIKNPTKEQFKKNLEKGSETIESVQVPTQPLAKDGPKCRTFVLEEPSDETGMDSDIEYVTEKKPLRPNPLAKDGQKCQTFLSEEPNDETGMDSDIEYFTEQEILRPKPHQESRIDYHHFYRFDANAISCRNCPYRRTAQKRFTPTRALKSHLKKHHLTVMEQYRRSNNILKEDRGKNKKEDEEPSK